MEYNADGTMKLPAKPLVNEKIHAPDELGGVAQLREEVKSLRARVDALENQKPAEAPPASAEGAVS